MTFTRRRLLIAGALLCLGALAVPLTWPYPASLSALSPAVVLDARGEVLRATKDEAGYRGELSALDALPEAYIDALLASEDHLFYSHPGVDPLAIARAVWLNVRAGKRVSGASTLAMQLARIAYDLPRDFRGKLAELVLAPYLTARLGRAGVLHAYVNLVHFGRDLRGVGAASAAYFGKAPRDLTLGEAVLLACLPRAPSAYDPYRHADRLMRRRAHVLALMEARGLIAGGQRVRAAADALRLKPFARAFRAPHAVDFALREAQQRSAGSPTRILTTIDSAAQESAQRACRDAVAELRDRGATGCAAVVMRASTMEILALVGSPSFASPHAGQVNAALAPRQPGSALKPFVYALAFESGQNPGDLIDDEPAAFQAGFGSYRPENYDDTFHGRVTLREALANSYNVPAVKLAHALGIDRVLARLRALGLETLDASPEHYGVGLALGDGEVRLVDLTAAYATLARGGAYLAPTLIARASEGETSLTLRPRAAHPVFTPEAAFMVADVLADDAARRASFGTGSVLELPFRTSVKTGTSSRYRDNLTVGFAGDVVVGVWVGRHDGASLHGVSGVSGAAPAFRAIMLSVVRGADGRPAVPVNLVRSQQGERLDLALRAPARATW